MASKASKLKVFALGGLHEIGKNMTVFEYGQDIIVVDCGVSFPEDDMLGIDLVIPDTTYLVKNKDKIRGLVLTHGHEDHIGAIPYFFRDINVPVYATRLTLGLVDIKLKEHNLLNKVTRNVVEPGDVITLGKFTVEFIGVTHSIADSVALAINTPVGMAVYSGDFKVDHTPIDGQMIDLQRFAVLGKKGVLLMLCESTNVELKGYTSSEKVVGHVFEGIFAESRKNRIMIATFSSNIHRIQQAINCAVNHGRKVAFVGRSMVNVAKTAVELGYLDIPAKVLIDVSDIRNYEDHELVIITTGTQGEPMSALTRMASSEHRQVEIKPGDKIIISASSIPGNERSISRVVNELFKRGAEVIYEGMADTHVSGHARQEEIKLMHALVKPKFFMPIHGEFRHLKQHKALAVSMGMPPENIFVMNIGDVLELNSQSARAGASVPSGQVLVDGLGVGDVGNIVLRDRRILSQDGLIVVFVTVDRASGSILSGPEIISRGFVYVRESEDLMEEARKAVSDAIVTAGQRGVIEWNQLKSIMRDSMKEFVWQKTKRSPMILPVVMDV